jgi:hypothetical protein
MFKYFLILLGGILILGGMFYFFILRPDIIKTLPTNTEENTEQPQQIPVNNYYQREQNNNASEPNNSLNITDTRGNEETLITQNIQTNLKLWNESKSKEILIILLQTTGFPDNESILEEWELFMMNDSNEILKALGDGSQQELNKSAHIIFEWFIQSSTSYTQLSDIKKQEILRQFQQIQLFLRN